MAAKFLRAAGAAIAGLLFAGVAQAQELPAPSLPLGGGEWFACWQAHAAKSCTPADIAQFLSGDVSVAASGAVTISKIGGVPVGPLATTPASTFTAHGLVLGEGSGSLGEVAPLAAGQLAIGQGVGSDPTALSIGGDATLGANGVLTVTGVSHLSGALPNTVILQNPTTSSLGGVQALLAVAHKWINQISASGVPSASQPTCEDLSDGTAACSTPVGAAGAVIPLLNGNNTYSGNNTHTGKEAFAAASTANAGMNLGQGVAPTTPANGDIWVTPSGVFAQSGGSTVQLGGTSFGVSTFNGRSGAVSLTSLDVTNALGTSSLVNSFNTRTGAISLLGSDLAGLTSQLNVQSAYVAVSAGGSLTAAQTGADVEITATSTITENLPTPVGNAGVNYQIYNSSAVSQNLSIPAGTFAGTSGSGSTTQTLTTGSRAEIFSDGANWIVYTPNAINGGLKIGGTLTPSTTNGIAGTTAGDNACAGCYGEVLSNSVSGLSVSSGAYANITTLTLTAGDWDVSCFMTAVSSAAASITIEAAGVSTTSGTFTSLPGGALQIGQLVGVTVPASFQATVNAAPGRINVTGNTTVYLVGLVTFSGGTMTVDGYIRARRIR